MKTETFVGKHFGEWEVISLSDKNHYLTRVCSCGNVKDVYKGSLKAGISSKCKACSNKRNKTSHGMSTTPLYTKWRSMLDRCTLNKDSHYYVNYAARGISVCERWKHSFENFRYDIQDIFIEGLEMDRIDNDKGYFKENIRFVTRAVNMGNARISGKVNFRGVSLVKSNNKFAAYITVNYLRINLGSFSTAELAARAYDKFCLYNGVIRPLNFNY